jgi:hypothetical protein
VKPPVIAAAPASPLKTVTLMAVTKALPWRTPRALNVPVTKCALGDSPTLNGFEGSTAHVMRKVASPPPSPKRLTSKRAGPVGKLWGRPKRTST